jgi:hypothetical protein
MVTIEDFIHESADVDEGEIPEEVRQRVNDALEDINPDLYGTDDDETAGLEPPASNILERTRAEFEKRTSYSKQQLLDDRDTSPHEANGRISEDAVIAKFGKGLEHDDDTGLPTVDAYTTLVEACENGEGYDAIPTGGPRPLVQPESAWTYMTEGGSTAQLRIARPPAFDSPEAGAEMIELYWRALTRDVKFRDYDDNDLVQKAVDELDSLDAYNGPGADGTVTTDNVFRGVTPGATTGPYVSQFLWKDRNLGGGVEDQKIEVQEPGSDYATTVTEWKKIQNGEVPSENELTGSRRHIITGRDLSERVHDDPPFRQLQKAAQVLVFTMNAPLDEGIPYTLKPFSESGRSRRNPENFRDQVTLPFNDFGPLYIEKKVLEASEHGQKAAWHKKWNVHRRLRPEEYGGRVQATRGSGLPSPDGVDLESEIPDNLLGSDALAETKAEFGSYLLPQAYAEGSPTHPSYPAGHSVVAGAGATVLKALFDGDYEFPASEKVVPTRDGETLETAEETDAMGVDETLTVRGELNKLASNMALGRNRAGIHYRSDGIEGLRLGEAAAVRFLEDQLALQTATGDIRLSFETFDGDSVTIEPSA